MDWSQWPLLATSLVTLAKYGVLILLFVLPMAALLTWMERRQSAISQDRLGPTRASLGTLWGQPLVFAGLLHVIADACKMFFKEPFRPRAADPWLFTLAPAIGFVASLTVMSFVPFGPALETGWAAPWHSIPLQIVPHPHSLWFVLAFGSLGIYGAALAGWSSRNRFALLGGLRASAQQISYEVALGLTLVGMLVLFGTADLHQLVLAQEGLLLDGWLPNWGFFYQPLAALLFFVAAMAETKRAPFDLPEGESEIVGYFLEYSSMGFGLFMLGEFVEVVVLASLFTTLFLGGWQAPWLLGQQSWSLGPWSGQMGPWLRCGLGMGIFASKVVLLCMLQLQIRWTLPRFRYDQLMDLGWKTLLPLALLNLLWTAVACWLDPSYHLLIGTNLLVLLGVIVLTWLGPIRHVAKGQGKHPSMHSSTSSLSSSSINLPPGASHAH